MEQSRPTVVVVGAGPGVSGSLARRYAGEGYAVALVGRNPEELARLADEVTTRGAPVLTEVVDVADGPALATAVTRIGERWGHVDVLHVNPSAYRPRTPLELTVEELLADVAVGVGPLLTTVQAARPYLRSGARVTATGSVAADRPSPAAASLGVQKAALRNLVRSLDAALRPEGVRAVSVTVDGVIDRADPASLLHPDAIAAALDAAAHQDERSWRSELRHPPADAPT